jgi:hypothetical protein
MEREGAVCVWETSVGERKKKKKKKKKKKTREDRVEAEEEESFGWSDSVTRGWAASDFIDDYITKAERGF